MFAPQMNFAFENQPARHALWALASPGTAGGGSPEAGDERVDLGPGIEIVAFAPGRYANAIQKNVRYTHAQQLVREETTSSFVVNLETGGAATVCRGWRYLSSNDGPEVHTSETIREQLGYRGRWEKRGKWVSLDLKLDDNVCARVGNYSHLIPDHSTDWHLRCLPIVPRGHSLLTAAALACQSRDVQGRFGEDEPHLVEGILPDRWLILGAGNGLRFRVESCGVGSEGAPVLHVENSPEPVPTGAWEHSF